MLLLRNAEVLALLHQLGYLLILFGELLFGAPGRSRLYGLPSGIRGLS